MMLTPKELRERLIANSCGSDDHTPNIRINCAAPEPIRDPVFVPPPATPVSTIILNRLDKIEKRLDDLATALNTGIPPSFGGTD